MKVEDLRNEVRGKIARDFPSGYYMGSVSEYSGLFIRAYNHVTMAARPELTWTLDCTVKDWRRVHGTIRIERNG